MPRVVVKQHGRVSVALSVLARLPANTPTCAPAVHSICFLRAAVRTRAPNYMQHVARVDSMQYGLMPWQSS